MESLFCIPENSTTLKINYVSIKIKKIKYTLWEDRDLSVLISTMFLEPNTVPGILYEFNKIREREKPQHLMDHFPQSLLPYC